MLTELEILMIYQCAHGCDAKRSAASLEMSVEAVEKELASACKKLNAKTPSEAVYIASLKGLIGPDFHFEAMMEWQLNQITEQNGDEGGRYDRRPNSSDEQ